VITLIRTMLTMDAVRWPAAVDVYGRRVANEFGQPQWLPPQELHGETEDGVFWIDSREEYVAGNGQKVMSKAVVFVGVDCHEGDVLMKGTLADIPPGLSGRPTEVPNAYVVMRFEKKPTLDSSGGDADREYVRKCYL